MEAATGLDPERIIEILESANAGVLSPDEGLRERKKRRLRQRISNVATALFLAEGFEAVSVARIAARSEISEQTVFNYFPTKESMFFDEADDLSRAIAEAIRDPANGRLSDVVRPALIGPAFPDRWPGVDPAEGLAILRQVRGGGVLVTHASWRAVPRDGAVHGHDRRGPRRAKRDRAR